MQIFDGFLMTLTNNITHSHDNKFILKESIEEKLYQIIRSEIRKGDLKQGTILVQGTLADKYGVSRIPVRSALQLLEKDGLIHKINNKGSFVVTEYNRDEISEMIELSNLIELKIVSNSFTKFTDFGIKQLTALNQKIKNCSMENYRDLNHEFHLVLFSYSDKRLFRKFAVDLRETRPMYMSIKSYADIRKAYEEHQEMIEAIKKGKREIFIALYDKHIHW